MTIRQWIKSAITIPDPEQISDLTSWRHWLVNNIVTLIVLFTLPIYLLFILPAGLRQGYYLLAGVELAMYAAGGFNILSKGRTCFGTSAFWMLLLQILIPLYYYYRGPGFGATAWLIMITVFYAVYYGTRLTVFSVGANIAILSILFLWVRPQSPEWLQFYGNPHISWIGYLAIVGWIAMVSGLAVGFLLDRMDQTLQRERRSNSRLKESEMKFRAFFESNPNGIIVSDLQGRIIEVNKAFTKTIGYAREELTGRLMTDFVVEDQPEQLEQRLADLKAGILGDSLYELRYYRNDGSISHATCRGWLILDEQSAPAAIGVHFRDVSMEKNLLSEKSVLEIQLQQAQKMEAIGTLAGGIAHDFNNILAGIIGYAELAQMELSGTSYKSKDYLAQLLTAGARARDLVQQILRFSRQEKSSKGPVSVTAVVKEVVKLMRSTLPSTIRINAHLEKGSLMITADATQIHQLAMNLCTNGYQAMRDRHGTLGINLCKVRLKSEKRFQSMSIPSGEYVRLTVSDTGDGIAPEVMDKIFDPYFTTKQNGDGTGLGLAVTLGVVNEHGGLIDVQSALRHGASFSVYLPFEQTTFESAEENDPYISTGNNEQILVVDDERFFVDVVAENLSGLGYGVEGFNSSVAALQRFHTAAEKFHLVISDQTMPEMTGLQLLSEIRQIRPDIPFILCTGYSDQSTEKKIMQADNVHLLMKPVTRKELATAVYNTLNGNSAVDPKA